ncbi:MAG: anti-sigma F factor [Defluviitaleaceae bacterium]|nr:anti-sigma F factor [Defluviitaleaceae bacterium]MCL2835307.1 anti-sigma F factor [Defluviitaleaceae bacterium]
MLNNEMQLSFRAISANESFARTVAAAFVTGLNPTISEIMEIKTAVSEAVTNAIIHGYENKGLDEFVHLNCRLNGRELYIEVVDNGIGIQDIAQAMEPLYTSKPEQERSGMGFAVMENFMDYIHVTSAPGQGTTVVMMKKLPE